MEFLKKHPKTSAVVGVVGFFGTCWGLSTHQTVPEWYNSQGLGMNSFTLLVLLALVLIVMFSVIIFHQNSTWSSKLREIAARHYKNESVEIDGRRFRNCQFENVTFVFRGTGLTEFRDCGFSGQIAFESKNQAVSAYQTLVQNFMSQSPAPTSYATKDESGKLTIVNTVVPIQEKKPAQN